MDDDDEDDEDDEDADDKTENRPHFRSHSNQ